MSAKTIRQIVRSSIGGSSVRLRLSNCTVRGRSRSVLCVSRRTRPIGDPARHGSANHIQRQTDRYHRTRRRRSEDPVAFTVAALEQLAISLYVVDSGNASTCTALECRLLTSRMVTLPPPRSWPEAKPIRVDTS